MKTGQASGPKYPGLNRRWTSTQIAAGVWVPSPYKSVPLSAVFLVEKREVKCDSWR